MMLRTILQGLKITEHMGDMDAEIKGITHDSRRLGEGELFVALKGLHFDGGDFIGDAVQKGAAAVLYEGHERPEAGGGARPFVRVEDTREALALISNNFYSRPSEKLMVIGVTGTNGKTTVTRIIKSILEADGKTVGLIGTINYMVGRKAVPAPFTTPESVDFQRLLHEMLQAGCSHVVAEVSSHALMQKRVDFTRFGLAVFTNLTRDHLDFHGGMEEYFGAKRKLFEGLLSGPAVVNADDPYGARLLSSIRGKAVSYGTGGDADLTAGEIKMTPEGLSFRLGYRGEGLRVESSLMGRPNVYNILAAAGACLALGVSGDAVLRGIKDTRPVEGRFEKVELGQDFLCLVDYAHTEDALRGLILTAREFTEGRVITVFGCGGERDRGKRPAMGAAATELSDLVFITTDNPRGEDPGEIIGHIVEGTKKRNYRVVPDRQEAIAGAVGEARASDTVLIAGKGHEDYQEIMGRRYDFSDREMAVRAINEKIRRA
jgi:UDP-N-acetylmuramoyl-L-alanyl-D-glutamate--2,6-diaminopimelate ligase